MENSARLLIPNGLGACRVFGEMEVKAIKNWPGKQLFLGP